MDIKEISDFEFRELSIDIVDTVGEEVVSEIVTKEAWEHAVNVTFRVIKEFLISKEEIMKEEDNILEQKDLSDVPELLMEVDEKIRRKLEVNIKEGKCDKFIEELGGYVNPKRNKDKD